MKIPFMKLQMVRCQATGPSETTGILPKIILAYNSIGARIVEHGLHSRSRTGAVVSVPNPASFEFHKLIVSVERRTQNPLKASMDMAQATALLDYYLNHNTTLLLDAYAHVRSRGPGWKQRVNAGLKNLDAAARHLQIAERLQAAISEYEIDEGIAFANRGAVWTHRPHFQAQTARTVPGQTLRARLGGTKQKFIRTDPT